jgi:transcriptional regulator with XRE-family HTH domain
MRRNVVDNRLKARLVTLMLEQDLTAGALAKKANVSRSYLSEIVNGQKMPSEQVAKALEEALGEKAKDMLVPLVAIAALADDLDPLAYASNNPHRADQAAIDAFARVLSAQRHLEDSVGAAAVLRPSLPQMDTITAMVRCTAGPLRPKLLYVAGQWAQFLGWLHTSLGAWDEARSWNRTALEWATELGDPDLIATVLSYQAHVSWLTLSPGPTIGLSEAALRDPGVYPGQRAYDWFQAAKAYAYRGDVDEARSAMAAGAGLAAEIESWVGEVPPWQYYRAPWLWQLERGLVHLYLDRWEDGSALQAETAVRCLRSGLDAMPEYMLASDWAAEYQVYLVAAYIQAGAAQSAREVLEDARRVAETTSSRRVLALVAGRERQLARLG